MSEHHTTDIMVSFGIALLVGAVGALLLAPASGEETRKRLGEFGDDAR
jgi:gas vesicle protein